MQKSEKIFVAGHRGMVGSALIRTLEAAGFSKLLKRGRSELDLGDSAAVTKFFQNEKPEVVIFAAAKVYPKLAPQPIPESALLSGPLEPTNEAYAIAKIAGVKLCQAFSREYGANFISAMPTNLYGPNDNFDLETSHVLAALLRKAYEAKKSSARELVVWGTGTPRREFLHVDDCASACLFLLEKYDSPEIINVGCGEDISIHELAELICDVVGFDGELSWDKTKPDGTPRKLLDLSKLRGLGWTPTIPLRDGIARTYEWFLKNVAK